jgi:hypothetical protein
MRNPLRIQFLIYFSNDASYPHWINPRRFTDSDGHGRTPAPHNLTVSRRVLSNLRSDRTHKLKVRQRLNLSLKSDRRLITVSEKFVSTRV